MPDEVQDVNQTVDPSATDQTVVNQETVESSEQTTTQEQTTQPLEQGNSSQQFSAVDEMGVPWKNRFMENERKYHDLVNNFEKKIDEVLSTRKSQVDQQYTIPQLEAFIESTDNAGYRAWAKSEIEKVRQKETADIIRTEIGKFTQEQTSKVRRQRSFQYVMQNYPECFSTDSMGNTVWNPQHPLTREIGRIMQDPRFSNDPEGLAGAADIAFGRYSSRQRGQVQGKVQSLQHSVKKLQKQTFVEGSGANNAQPQPDSLQKAKDRLVNSLGAGKKERDGAIRGAVTEYFRKTGVIE